MVSNVSRAYKGVIKWMIQNFSNLKSSKLWSSQLWSQFKQLRIEACKSQDLNGVWTRDLTTPARRANQLSCEATDVWCWSFVTSNEPVKNGCEVVYEMFHILTCGFWNPVISIGQCASFTGIARSRVQTQFKSWLFQASIRNCVDNCDDHSLLDFKIRSSIYGTFHRSLHIYSSRAH